jgi:hypothetical protein
MKLITLLLCAFALSAQYTSDPPMVLKSEFGQIVVSPTRLYLQNTDGPGGPGVYAILTISATGDRRGILTVVNPATAQSIMLDPDQGILMNGKVVVPMPDLK